MSNVRGMVDPSTADAVPLSEPLNTPGRVVIISASMGAGHDGAAAELARRISLSGTPVDRFDLLDLLPAHLGRALGTAYHRLLVHAPWAYQRIYSSTEQAGGTGPAAGALLRVAERRVLRALPPDTSVIVSTYPGASRILGALRLGGRLSVPVLTYLTDFSVHPLWVAPGVDAHLAAHAVPAAQARALGASDVRVCGPVTDPRFAPAGPQERRAARARLGLPEDAPLALLVAGSWGVGPVRQVAAEIRAGGAAIPVVVCGRNTSLAERLRADDIGHVFGWTDDMPALMNAADVLVQNAGGLTSLEAFACGLPVASYRCIPGHGLTNAAALDEAGLAAWIRTPDALAPGLADLIHGPRGLLQRAAGLALFAAGPDTGPAAAVLRAGRSGASVPHPGSVTARRPLLPRTPRPRLAVYRLAATVAVACGLWAGGVGLGMAATAHDYPGLMRAIDHRLDPDDFTPAPTFEGSQP
ncbi:glycosyltransferase [Streptomyces sp. NPDC088732]|uniref:MGDG synthase family glycosyltransferase n=1 Tax=Streptomyces sp. NPDC088732 TaxID=3365879 RepID=UPI003816D1B0